jgi:hypothetical protein
MKNQALQIATSTLSVLMALGTAATASAANYPLAKETTMSLQVATPGYTYRYLRHAGGLASRAPVSEGSDQLLKNDAT